MLAPKQVGCQHDETVLRILLGHALDMVVDPEDLLEQQNAGAGACGWQGEIGVVGLAFAAVYRNPFGLHFLGHVVLLVQVNQAASAAGW